MSSKIFKRITLAEEKWLELIIPYLGKLFAESFLPSHDQGHHKRVWIRCKSLLLELERFESLADQSLIEGLLLASWFHDTGMTYDPGENHGELGREILEGFLRENRLQDPAPYSEVLNAIEHHDSKQRKLYPELRPGIPPDIMGILSLADDLDALGIVGIYRYSEIYLKRGLRAGLLGIRVLANVRKRYTNIMESCKAFPSIRDTFLSDFQLIEAFFNRYNQQLLIYDEPEKVRWGELGIVNYIRSFSVQGRVRPEDFLNQPGVALSGSIAESFFKKLHDELVKGL